MATITTEDIAEADTYQTLGPGYFAARRVAEQLMAGVEVEPLRKMAEKVTDDIRTAVYEYVEDHMRSDMESNLQGHIVSMVDDTVRALLTGETWAMQRYPLAANYHADDVRAAVAKHGGEPLLMARIADLEKENARLAEHLKWERERRY